MSVCCICESDQYNREYRIYNGYQLCKCNRCSLVYLDGRINPEEFIADAKEGLHSENKQTEYWSFPEMYHRYLFVFDNFFKERLTRCLRYNKNINTMFDIGAGYGFWMDYCRRQGIEVKGIEISEEAVNYGKEKMYLDIEKTSLEDFNFYSQYALYNLCDVLEHLKNPNRDLRIIHNAMKPESLLFVQVPDVLGFKIPINHNMGLPHHIWQFNFKTLKILLEKNGFYVLKKWHGIQGVIGCYERNEVNIFLKSKWLFAKTFNLGNRLMVLCKAVT
ncbi:MAG: class I SAM-dependent methyltransferase [Candidatus Scalindua sp.]|jgi:SAM-dependent methyltransferase|nr:class I SAM-dependent methyltransferase [Candidatus Scalindua sp.]